MPSRAVVFANGDLVEPEVIQERLAAWQDALFLAADGGSRHARRLGVHLGVVVGDMDSIDDHDWEALETSGTAFEVAPTGKDETDLELALLYAVRQGAQHIAVMGALGGRLDMTLANILVLLHPALTGLRVELWSGRQTAWVIQPPGDLVKGRKGDTFSLLPMEEGAHGVTTHGLKYPLRGETLFPGAVRGVSNVFRGAQARIDLAAGTLLAVYTPGRA